MFLKINSDLSLCPISEEGRLLMERVVWELKSTFSTVQMKERSASSVEVDKSG